MRPSARAWNRKTAAGELPEDLALRAPKAMDLRYGENPHQSAALYGERGRELPAPCSCTAGLSYNNLVDLDAHAAGARIHRAGGGDRQTHQSVRMRRTSYAGRGLP